MDATTPNDFTPFPVCPKDEIELGSARCFEILGRVIAIFRTKDDQFRAIDDTCPHRGASLASGWISSDDCINCPGHGSKFDSKTGQIIAPPAKFDRQVYPTEIRSDTLWVLIDNNSK